MDEPEYQRVLFEHPDKGYQYRLTLSEFRDVQYLNIRKYFLTYEGDYVPSKEGASIPATMSNILALLDALIELCSDAEANDTISKYFSDKISNLNS